MTAVQEQQLGTGHAVQVALEQLADLTGDVVVTYGDVPMLAAETLAALVGRASRPAGRGDRAHRPGARPERVRADPARRRRRWSRRSSSTGTPTTAQRAITEINSGIYVFDADDRSGRRWPS